MERVLKKCYGKRLFVLMAAGALLASTVPARAEDKKMEPLEKHFEEGEAIGKKAIGNFDTLLRNDTGKDIEKMELSVDGAGYSENLLEKDVLLKAGEAAHWYVTPALAKEEDVDPVYDLKVTFAGDKTSVLHALPLGDCESMDICLEGDVAYLVYTSQEEEVNTLEEEKKLAEEAAAKAAAAAATTYTDYGNATYGGATYEEPSYSYEPEYEESYSDYTYDDSYSYEPEYEEDYGTATYGNATYGNTTSGETTSSETTGEDSNYDGETTGGETEGDGNSASDYAVSEDQEDGCLGDADLN